ncbi:hypothetical protein ACPSKX_05835 [Moritella viscosa]
MKRQTTLLETALNNGSTLQRCVVFTCAFLVMAAIMFTEKSNISSFFFSNLPIGLGLTNTFVAPLVVLGLLMLSSAAYFCIVYVTKMSAPTHQKTERSCFLSELQLSLVFGACFGLLTATLCSLIFVVAEPYLPQEFLKYHQLFGSLDIALILLSGIVLSVLYLGLFMLPPVKLTTRIILTSSLIASLFVALLIAIITSTLSINLILFSVIISVITSMALSLLYWFVGLEASIIGNVVYCLLVSYLANIFL